MAEMEPGLKRARGKETNNYKQGRSGSKVMTKAGPAVGNTKGNSTKGGGITKPTRGKLR